MHETTKPTRHTDSPSLVITGRRNLLLQSPSQQQQHHSMQSLSMSSTQFSSQPSHQLFRSSLQSQQKQSQQQTKQNTTSVSSKRMRDFESKSISSLDFNSAPHPSQDISKPPTTAGLLSARGTTPSRNKQYINDKNTSSAGYQVRFNSQLSIQDHFESQSPRQLTASVLSTQVGGILSSKSQQSSENNKVSFSEHLMQKYMQQKKKQQEEQQLLQSRSSRLRNQKAPSSNSINNNNHAHHNNLRMRTLNDVVTSSQHLLPFDEYAKLSSKNLIHQLQQYQFTNAGTPNANSIATTATAQAGITSITMIPGNQTSSSSSSAHENMSSNHATPKTHKKQLHLLTQQNLKQYYIHPNFKKNKYSIGAVASNDSTPIVHKSSNSISVSTIPTGMFSGGVADVVHASNNSGSQLRTEQSPRTMTKHEMEMNQNPSANGVSLYKQDGKSLWRVNTPKSTTSSANNNPISHLNNNNHQQKGILHNSNNNQSNAMLLPLANKSSETPKQFMSKMSGVFSQLSSSQQSHGQIMQQQQQSVYFIDASTPLSRNKQRSNNQIPSARRMDSRPIIEIESDEQLSLKSQLYHSSHFKQQLRNSSSNSNSNSKRASIQSFGQSAHQFHTEHTIPTETSDGTPRKVTFARLKFSNSSVYGLASNSHEQSQNSEQNGIKYNSQKKLIPVVTLESKTGILKGNTDSNSQNTKEIISSLKQRMTNLRSSADQRPATTTTTLATSYIESSNFNHSSIGNLKKQQPVLQNNNSKTVVRYSDADLQLSEFLSGFMNSTKTSSNLVVAAHDGNVKEIGGISNEVKQEMEIARDERLNSLESRVTAIHCVENEIEEIKAYLNLRLSTPNSVVDSNKQVLHDFHSLREFAKDICSIPMEEVIDEFMRFFRFFLSEFVFRFKTNFVEQNHASGGKTSHEQSGKIRMKFFAIPRILTSHFVLLLRAKLSEIIKQDQELVELLLVHVSSAIDEHLTPKNLFEEIGSDKGIARLIRAVVSKLAEDLEIDLQAFIAQYAPLIHSILRNALMKDFNKLLQFLASSEAKNFTNAEFFLVKKAIISLFDVNRRKYRKKQSSSFHTSSPASSSLNSSTHHANQDKKTLSIHATNSNNTQKNNNINQQISKNNVHQKTHSHVSHNTHAIFIDQLSEEHDEFQLYFKHCQESILESIEVMRGFILKRKEFLTSSEVINAISVRLAGEKPFIRCRKVRYQSPKEIDRFVIELSSVLFLLHEERIAFAERQRKYCEVNSMWDSAFWQSVKAVYVETIREAGEDSGMILGTESALIADLEVRFYYLAIESGVAGITPVFQLIPRVSRLVERVFEWVEDQHIKIGGTVSNDNSQREDIRSMIKMKQHDRYNESYDPNSLVVYYDRSFLTFFLQQALTYGIYSASDIEYAMKYFKVTSDVADIWLQGIDIALHKPEFKLPPNQLIEIHAFLTHLIPRPTKSDLKTTTAQHQ